ncbi:ComEC/Rec2 family competence protein [Komagataeibacter medellinensis]|uniref:DNA translocation competence protein ComEC/Rec2 n=1 Tax=Komagataeibacter medellinensis (strain NBRC 3288 / BCRC 11682 / LMG 1693 / Kondo 51) TaxID=634177 RepID=G2I6A9_KOMMN|nr:ComEC/Rec2 family competence protein [Komagataeibacter medellinensis]BAK83656.1 DNA translocation competence protein ComEC/Rec2 [Komagataeibacter medellinensis NBRC 3288]
MPGHGRQVIMEDSLSYQYVSHIQAVFSRMQQALAAWLWGQHGRFVLWLPVLLAAGIAVYFALPWEPGGMAAFGAGMMAMACLAGRLLWRDSLPVRMGCGMVGACAVGLLLAWGQAHRMPPFPDLPRRAVHLSGRVTGVNAQTLRDGTQALRVGLADVRFLEGINIGMPPLRRQIALRLRPDDPSIPVAGDTLSARVMLTPPAFPAMPGGYDAQRRAWFDGLAGHGRALDRVACAHPPVTPAMSARLDILRQGLGQRISAALPGPRGTVAATVLVGADGVIAADMRQSFADAGLAHLLAVAGLHLAIVMGLTMTVVRTGLALSERAALFWPCRQIAALCALLAGAGYVLLTGAHLPAQRSLLMAALAVGALFVGRRPLSMRALAVAAAVLMGLAPEAVVELPLQMSMAAVMALIAGFDGLRPVLSAWAQHEVWWRRMGARVSRPLLASMLAGGACVPVGMAHFGTVQPWFVLANLLAVPLMSVWIMPWGLASLLLMPLGAEKLALVPMGWGIGVVAWLARLVAHLPVAHVSVPAMGSGGLVLFFAGLCWLCLWAGRARFVGVVPVVMALLSPFIGRMPVVLVSPDARIVGVVTGQRLLSGPGMHPDPFILREWQRVTGLRAGLLPVDGRQDGVACHGGVCRVAGQGGDIVLLLGARLSDAALCLGAEAVVNLHGQTGCPGADRIGRFDVWREGAYALYPRAGGGLVVKRDRAVRGARPWVMRPGGAGMPDLPLAQAE